MKKFLLILTLIICLPYSGWAACTWDGNNGTVASPYDVADVAACVSDASSKTGAVIITIPACTVTWASPLTVNMGSGFTNVTSLTIIGAGTVPSTYGSSGDVNITLNASGFQITGASGKKWRISNLSLTGSAPTNYKIFMPSGTSKPSDGGGWRVDHITMRSITSTPFTSAFFGTTAGVIDNIDYVSGVQFSNWSDLRSAGGYGNYQWNNDLVPGDMVYIEGSRIESTAMPVTKMLADISDGAQVVIRHNTIIDFYAGGHDASSDARSGRWYTINNNDWTHTGSSGGANSAFGLRGGSGVFYKNKLTFPGSNPFSHCTVAQGGKGICLTNYRSDESVNPPSQTSWPASIFQTYCDNTAEYMCVGSTYWSNSACDPASPSACNSVQANCQAIDANSDTTGWPCRDQIGRGKNQESMPMLFWGNTSSIGGGAYVDAVPAVDQNSYVTTHIQADRDFCSHATTMPATCNSVSTAYTAETCPHPLTGLTGSCDSSQYGTAGYNVAAAQTGRISGGSISGGSIR